MEAAALMRRTGGATERLVALWAQTEARDKLTKCLQYGCRTLSWVTMSHPEASKRFAALMAAAADGRKIFRLGKFLNELLKMRDIAVAADFDSMKQMALFLSRLGFFGFWFFDNIAVLSKIRFLPFDAKRAAKRAAFFWLCGLLFGLLHELYSLRALLRRELRLRRQLIIASSSSPTTGGGKDAPRRGGADRRDDVGDAVGLIDAEKELVVLKAKKATHFQNIVKNCGDVITAANVLELPHLLRGGKGFSDGVVGIGGFTSAAISVYQLLQLSRR